MEFPIYMNEGTKGPHVVPVYGLLCGTGKGEGLDVSDQTYGPKFAAAMRMLQRQINAEPDGNFGPETRRQVKKYFYFDLESACYVIPGSTFFVQPDGTVQHWTSPAPDHISPE